MSALRFGSTPIVRSGGSPACSDRSSVRSGTMRSPARSCGVLQCDDASVLAGLDRKPRFVKFATTVVVQYRPFKSRAFAVWPGAAIRAIVKTRRRGHSAGWLIDGSKGTAMKYTTALLGTV